MQILRGRRKEIYALAVSPDSRYVAVRGPQECHIWDLHEPDLCARALPQGDKATINLLFTSPIELFARGVDASLYRHNFVTEAMLTLKLPARDGNSSASSGIVSPNGTQFKAISRRSVLENFRITGEGLASLGPAVPLAGASLLIDNDLSGTRYLASVMSATSGCPEYYLFDTATDTRIKRLELSLTYTYTHIRFVFSPDGRLVYTAAQGRLYAITCDMHAAPTASCEIADLGHRGGLAVHPDGRILATVESEREVAFRDAETLQVLRTYDFDMPKVTCVAFTPDGTRCVVGNSRGKVLLFDVE